MGATPTAPLRGPLLGEVTGLVDDFSGVVGLWGHGLRHREAYGLRAEESFRPASTIKLFVLRELFRQAEADQVSLAEEVPVRSQDMVPGSGVLKDLGGGIWLR